MTSVILTTFDSLDDIQNQGFFCFFGFFFLLFRAAPAAYGGSQARGQIRALAASLQHSHNNSGSEPHL